MHISQPDAQFKSFKLSVTRSAFNEVFNENLFPKGWLCLTLLATETRVKVVSLNLILFLSLFILLFFINVLHVCICTTLSRISVKNVITIATP